MNENLPDLSKLIERLMRPYLAVTLGPSELMDGGTKMRLWPMRNGVPIADIDFVREETFPTLDLAKAGIEIDRRPDSVSRAVAAMLRNQNFILKPEFDVINEYANASLKDVDAAKEAAFIADMRTNGSATDAEVMKAAMDIFTNLHPVSISIGREGAQINGLDLSHPIRGWRAAMVSLLIPLKSQERVVLDAVGRFVVADRRLTGVSKTREKHAADGGGQWVRHPIASVRLWATDKVWPTFHANRVVALAKLNDSVASLM